MFDDPTLRSDYVHFIVSYSILCNSGTCTIASVLCRERRWSDESDGKCYDFIPLCAVRCSI